MKTLNFLIVTIIALSSFADTRSTNEEAQLEQYSKNSNEYQLKMAQLYKSLAFTAAEARVQKNLICEEGTYTADIVSSAIIAVQRASYVSTEEAKKMSTELLANKDVVTVGAKSFSFREATLYSTPYSDSLADLTKFQTILVGTKFWGPGMGAYGSMKNIEFISEKEAVIETLEVLNEEPWSKWNSKTVKYTIEQTPNGIVLVVDNERFTVQKDWTYWGLGTGTYIIIPEGTQPDANGYLIPTYLEYPSECEA